MRGIWELRFDIFALWIIWNFCGRSSPALLSPIQPQKVGRRLTRAGSLDVLGEYLTITSKWLGSMHCCILHKLPLALTGVILSSLPFRKLSGSGSGWPLLHFVRWVLGVGLSCFTKLLKDWRSAWLKETHWEFVKEYWLNLQPNVSLFLWKIFNLIYIKFPFCHFLWHCCG